MIIIILYDEHIYNRRDTKQAYFKTSYLFNSNQIFSFPLKVSGEET